MNPRQKLITDEMAQTAFDWLATNSDDVAQARGEQIRAEFKAKKVLARQFLNADGSIEVRKALAQCSDEYQTAMCAHADAEAHWEKLKDQRNKLQLLIEAWRTQQSNERGIVRASR